MRGFGSGRWGVDEFFCRWAIYFIKVVFHENKKFFGKYYSDEGNYDEWQKNDYE